ncbi:sensor histidine kinase [Azospirillum soli]|uniref:sensor histidine kinase n=1 Tax=Azospirillum soli TaxID=1304799 RepID=UPI001AE413CA|nr:histidine kinase dimerization/phosphoacceptor domain -containing protein [Azospirillum soli]MBP2313759.1 two-component sensor histidine kinase [Azospirillum soli]
MGSIGERTDEVEELRRQLAICEQEREQLAVALEDAQAEVERLAEQVARLQADNRHLRRSAGGMAHLLKQRMADPVQEEQSAGQTAPSQTETENAILAEELQVTVEELQVTAEELEKANEELRQLNQELERRVRERTEALERTLVERDALLRRKELLVKEVDHRVRNSLQMATSLLSLQGRKASAETRQALQLAIGRIHAIGRVHALLYDKGNSEAVRFDSYLQEVCTNLATSFGVDHRRRTLLVEAEPIWVPADAALPLATAVNELVTNALWHAFSIDTPGTVWVQFHREENGRLTLTVADDGRGMKPRHNDIGGGTGGGTGGGSCGGLGLEIVSSIALGLRADMTIGRKGGTRVTLSLPAMPHPQMPQPPMP